MKSKKKVLLISYDFPPIGGGGIQRNVKFLKYLHRLGWDTSVLTVKERTYYVYDTTLLNEVKGTKIYRSYSLDPVSVVSRIKKIVYRFNLQSKAVSFKETASNTINESAWYVDLYRKIRDWLLLPDGYGGWIPFATRTGYKIANEDRPDIIYGTFPYVSNAFTTYNIAKKFNIPYVIDFRDAWLDDPYVSFPSFLHKKYHLYYEKKIIENASKIIVYGLPLKDILERKYPIIKGNVEVITNGYDPEDFEGLTPIKKSDLKTRIVYSGAVYVDRRETYTCFIQAVNSLPNEIKDRLEIVFVGDKLEWATQLVKSYNLDRVITFTGYLSHKEALNYLSSADSALMFLKKGDKVALTGKIFEYLGLRLPVIACVEPFGACADLLKSINHAQGVCSPDDPTEIASKIISLTKGELQRLEGDNFNIFSRKHHSERLSQILDSITNKVK